MINIKITLDKPKCKDGLVYQDTNVGIIEMSNETYRYLLLVANLGKPKKEVLIDNINKQLTELQGHYYYNFDIKKPS